MPTNLIIETKMGFKSAAKTFRRHHVEERFPAPRYNIFMIFLFKKSSYFYKEQKKVPFLYICELENLHYSSAHIGNLKI